MKATEYRATGSIQGLNQKNTVSKLYDIAAINNDINLYKETLQRVKGSDFYYFADGVTFDIDHNPYVYKQGFEVIYGNTSKWTNSFVDEQQLFSRRANHIIARGSTLEDMVKIGPELLSASYNIAGFFEKLNSAKPEPDKRFANISEFHKVRYPKLLEEFSAEKPEEFRETLRRYMPRWLWFAIDFPAELRNININDDSHPWGQFNPKDANFLIHPDQIKEGKAPLHIALKTAQKIEPIDDDTAYQLKVSSITTLLKEEKRRFEFEDNAEPPFFTYIMAGIMHGSTIPPRKERPFFNYEKAIKDTIGQTYSRLQEELEVGIEGKAGQFLNELALVYKDNFPQLVANSLLEYGAAATDFDEIRVLKRFSKGGSSSAFHYEWMQQVLERAKTANRRRVLTAEEAVDLSKGIQRFDAEQARAGLIDNISQIVGDSDSYHISVPVTKMGLRTDGTKIETEINLDMSLENLDAKVTFTKGKLVRQVAFGMSFSGEEDSFQFESIDDFENNQTAFSAYRDLATMAISYEADKKRERQSRLNESQKKALQAEPQLVFAFTKLTRAERMRRYAQLNEQLVRSRKTTGIAGIGYETTSSEPDEIAESAEKRGITIEGLDTDNVAKLLGESKVTRVKPDAVINKLSQAAKTAEVGKTMFGKHVQTAREVGIKLRQYNWTIDGGTSPLRFYFEHTDVGTFKLEGIILKRNNEQQQVFIEDLIEKIMRQRKSEDNS